MVHRLNNFMNDPLTCTRPWLVILDVNPIENFPSCPYRPGRRRRRRPTTETRRTTTLPAWLDGEVGRISVLGEGEDTAQITPKEFVDKMMERAGDTIKLVMGTCTGVETEAGSEPGADRKVTGIRYQPRLEGGGSEQNAGEQILPADCVIVSAGPWSCAVEDWFQGAIKLPMEGIKSTSIVWKQPEGVDVVDATALFCGEDNRFGTHCKYKCILFFGFGVIDSPRICRQLVLYLTFLGVSSGGISSTRRQCLHLWDWWIRLHLNRRSQERCL